MNARLMDVGPSPWRVPAWTSSGVAEVLGLVETYIAELERRGLTWSHLVESQFEGLHEYESIFGDTHAGRQIMAAKDLIFAPESNLLTFPTLVQPEHVDRLALSVVQRYRQEPRTRPGWRDRCIWPAIGLNAVGQHDSHLTLDVPMSVHAAVLESRGVPTLAVASDRGEYGTSVTLVTEHRATLTGVAMGYELGTQFRQHVGASRGQVLLNTGITGKVLLLAPRDCAAPQVTEHLLFDEAAVVHLCQPCCRRVAWVCNGFAVGRELAECRLCGTAQTPAALVTKRNDFY